MEGFHPYPDPTITPGSNSRIGESELLDSVPEPCPPSWSWILVLQLGLEVVRNNQLYHEDGMFQNSKRLNFRNPVKKTPVVHLLVGVEEAITQEHVVTDPKCGISNMNKPPG